VLRPGGRLAFTVWCGPANNKFFGTITGVIVKHSDMSGGHPRARAKSSHWVWLSLCGEERRLHSPYQTSRPAMCSSEGAA